MAWQRWTFFDPVTADEFTFAINPNDGGEPSTKKAMGTIATTASDGATLLHEGNPAPKEIDFKGVVLSTADRDALQVWVDKKNQILWTNDIGEQRWIYIDVFQPARKRVASRPYKADYTLHAFILDIP